MNHACDYSMEANNLLSSIITYDETSPLLFRDESKDNLNNTHPLTYQKSLLLETLQGLSTVNAIDMLNNNSSTKQSSCKDAIMLIRKFQLDGGANNAVNPT